MGAEGVGFAYLLIVGDCSTPRNEFQSQELANLLKRVAAFANIRFFQDMYGN